MGITVKIVSSEAGLGLHDVNLSVAALSPEPNVCALPMKIQSSAQGGVTSAVETM